MIEVTPSDHDFAPMHERMQWYIDEDIIPFCTTLVMRGTEVIDVSFLSGPRLASDDVTLGPDSIFRMDSSTKLATSVAAMTLLEEGCFALDEPIEQYLPEFAGMRVLRPDATTIDDVEDAAGPICINQLMSHSSGLSYGFLEPESIIDRAYNEAGLDLGSLPKLTLAELCERLGGLPLAYQPGTSWGYSFATDVMARLMEVVSGQRFDQCLQERVLGPLNMIDTAHFVPADKHDRLLTVFDPASQLRPMEPGLTPLRRPKASAEPPTYVGGGGGLYSTLPDYLTFVRMLVNNGEWDGMRVLQPETIALMRQSQLAPGVNVRFPTWKMRDTTFGLGFALKNAPAKGEPDSAIGEYHWGGMAGTHFWMSPGAGITGICMTQRMPAFWHPFSQDFKRLVYSIAD